jgi:hypothetical protein
MPAMNPISAAELALIQADLAAAVLDKPCVIRRPTRVDDAWGTQTEELTVISPDDLLVGMNQPSAGQLQNYAYLIGSLATWQVRMPVGTDVAAQDELTIEGQKLTVQVLLDLHSYPGLLTVLASEVKQ